MFGKVLEGMDIIYAIGASLLSEAPSDAMLTPSVEDVPKGQNDRPLEDVIIHDSGEVCQ